jgi:hypothetical protein
MTREKKNKWMNQLVRRRNGGSLGVRQGIIRNKGSWDGYRECW